MSRDPMWRRYRRFLGRDVEGDVDDELDFHLEMRVQEYVARGMDPQQAREHALRRFGDMGTVRDDCVREDRAAARRNRAREAMGTLCQDVRYAFRVLRGSPGFTVVAVLTIALGIGSTTAIFSLLNGVLLSPLPYPGADRLVVPQSHNLEAGRTLPVSHADYVDWREEGVFDQVALYRTQGVNVTGGGESERLTGARVTEDFFATLGTAPTLGRLLRPDEFVDGGPRVAVISYGLWQRRFGGEREVVGRTLRVEGEPIEVVGVMPREMNFPAAVELWLPLTVTPEDRPHLERRDNYAFSAVARLAPGKTLEKTRTELATLARRVEQENPQTRRAVTVTAVALDDWMVGDDLSRALWLFLGAVAFVLLIGCVNVANLLMSRAAARGRELAVRAALGASRGRLVRQLLTESLVLALAGGVLGALLAYGGVRLLVAAAPAELPRLDNVAVNGTVLGFALVVSVLCAVLFGLAPALRAAADPTRGALGEGSRRATTGVRGRRVRDALVVAELALSLVLLVGAGLLLRSFSHLRDTDPGFRTENVLTFALSLQGDRYEEDDAVLAAYGELVRRVEMLPGVRSVAATSSLPLGGGGLYLGRAFLAEGMPEPPAGPEVSAMWTVVTPGYFHTMGIPLLGGREFEPTDAESTVPVMVVNREFARLMFPAGDAIGKRVRSWRDENVYREIVGITDDVRFFGAGDEIRPLVYVPHAQDVWSSLVVTARTDADPGPVVAPIRTALREVDPELALSRIQTMEQVRATSVASQRFGALLLTSFALVALVLAVVGIYGVLSYVVAQRTREIGVRMALGAEQSDVQRMVVREAALVVGVGIIAGLGGALLLTRALAPLLYEVSVTDPATFGAVAALLAAVALAASWLPARRATRVDPMEALRWE